MKYGKRVDTRIRVFPVQIAVRISSVASSKNARHSLAVMIK